MNQRYAFGALASTPNACEHPTAWIMAEKGGDLAAENTINEGNTLTLTSLALGKDLSADLTQDATITAAALSMIASLECNLQNEGQLTGPMQMTLNLASNLVQNNEIDAGLGLIAWMQASLVQDADMSASNLRGTLSMEANIVSYTDFTAEGVRDAVWNAILANYPGAGSAGLALTNAGAGGNPWSAVIESGLTAEEILRIIASALAGKVSGAGTGTETFVGLDGTTNRIVSTVDGSGNRSSVVVDGT